MNEGEGEGGCVAMADADDDGYADAAATVRCSPFTAVHGDL
jgi:hypothetical protein